MNRNTLISLATFAIGAAAGSVVTWKLVKTKYERITQEEIDSVKEVFSRRAKEEAEEETEDEEDLEAKKAEVKSYKDVLSKTNYTGYSDGAVDINETIANKAKDIVNECNGIVNKEGGNESMSKDGPYIITPNELGEEYDVVTLVCYADGVITDYDSGEVVDDVEGAIGSDDIRTHFGEYEEDSVFVRNDERKVDYEVLRDEDAYSEVFGDEGINN